MSHFALVRQALKASLVLTVGLSFAACQNYTSRPMCDDDNAALPTGLTGTYTLSFQHEDFTTQTQEFKIDYSADGKKARIFSDEGEDEGRICEIGGQVLLESVDDATGYFQQDRLFVTGMGLTILPVFYDKASLDAAKIRNKVFVVPEDAAKRLGPVATTFAEKWVNRAMALVDEEVLGLVVINEGVRARDLMSHAKTGPVGLTYLRR